MDKDFCVEEMMETQFPDFQHPGKPNRYWRYCDRGTLSEFDWDRHDEDIQDWFKRALVDFPKEPDFWSKLAFGVDSYLVYAGKVEAWKEKWLSQFFID